MNQLHDNSMITYRCVFEDAVVVGSSEGRFSHTQYICMSSQSDCVYSECAPKIQVTIYCILKWQLQRGVYSWGTFYSYTPTFFEVKLLHPHKIIEI